MKEESKWKRFRQGMRDLTPLQLAQAQVTGYMGTFIGASLAFLTLLYRVVTGWDWLKLSFCIFVFFMAWLQYWQWMSARQRFQNLEVMISGILK